MRSLFAGLVMVLSWLISGCGGGYQSAGQYPADRSGSYTFTLGWTGGSLVLQGSLKQSQWTPCNGNLLCNGATYENNLTGSFSFPWCAPDSFTATGQLFYTPGQPETFAFAIFDSTASNNLLIMNAADFSTLAGTWQTGPAFTCATPSGNLTWTAVKH